MVSLCGLALSSLFVINNKSVVHADSVDANNQNNNNAISWDSDSDKAQQVQNDSEQSSVQKVDDHQQNQVSNVQSSAETSNVESSSVAPRTTNQSAAVQSPRVANVQDAEKTSPVVINNPTGDKINVHYVDRNGNNINDSAVKDTSIDVTKTGQGQYKVPTGYQVNDPNGKYDVTGGAFNGTLKAGLMPHAAVTTTTSVPTKKYGSFDFTIPWHSSTDQQDVHPEDAPVPDYLKDLPDFKVTECDVVSNTDAVAYYSFTGTENKTTVVSPAYTEQQLPVAFVDSNNNVVGMIQNYTGKVGTTQNVNLTVPTGYKLADGASLPTSVTFADNDKAQLIKVVPNGEKNSVQANKVHVKFVDQSTGQEVAGGYDITLSDTDTKSGVYNIPAGYGALHNTYGVNAVIGGVVFNQPDDPNGQPAFYVNDTDATKSSIAKKLINYYYNYWLKSDPSWANNMFFINKNATGNEAEYPDYGGYLSLKDGTWDKHDVGFTSHELNYLNDVATPNVNRKGISVHYTYGKPRFEDDYDMITPTTGNDPVIVTVPVHQSKTFMFTDNSGNVKSVSGNTVDVTLTKPQSVNPAMDTRCQSQATRTIQINFPDGQVPQSYDGIVDQSGKLVQTVHFTRTATEDALTGNILSYGNWTSDNQDHNFIGFEARTLPRIPGYTLSIKPAQA